MNGFRRRLERLEDERGAHSPAAVRSRRRRQALDEATAAFAGVIPPNRQNEVADFMDSDAWNGSPLAKVYALIECGSSWRPAPLRNEVLTVFLTDRRAEPWHCCDACGTLLPYCSGFWFKDGSSWQGPLLWFRRCPCGGRRCNYVGRAADLQEYLPEREVPPWTFKSEAEVWRERECCQTSRD